VNFSNVELLLVDGIIDSHGTVGGTGVGKETRCTQDKAVVVPLCLPQILYYLT
jgi:hypothetical protein